VAWPDQPALEALEARVERALAVGGPGDLEVLGYGEISAVLALEAPGGPFACKRLPPFAGSASLEAYRACLEDYLGALAGRGLRVAPTALLHLERTDGRLTAYCVQAALPPGSLLPGILARAGEGRARALFGRLLEAVERAVGPELGLDGQMSNWAVAGGELIYLDVTTPMMRDGAGAERLDTGLFLASLPWALRGPVRRFLLGGILEKYYQPRGVVLDALANLVKERLERWLPAFLEESNARVRPALSQEEVRRYYAADARTWALLQRLRRLDRAWQRRVRRRPYPFLLPGRIERHV
jgi:hypothetical protein